MRPRQRYSLTPWSVLVTSVLVLSSAVGTGLAVADVGPAPDVADGGSPSDAAIQRSPSFLRNPTVENRGDVATVAVDLGNRTETTLRVGPDDTASNSTAEIAVEDRDSDGSVAVRLNTYALGTDVDGAVTARGGDAADVRRSSSLDEPLRAGNYSLTLLVGNETVDEGTLVLEPASLDGLTRRVADWTRPVALPSPAAIRTAVENGTLVARDRLPLSQPLLVELRASGLSGPLASQPGPNATARFLALLEEPWFSLTVRENETTINLEEEGNEFLPTASGTTVIADPTNDTYYVLLDLTRLPRHTYTVPEDRAELEPGDTFDVNATVTPGSGVFERRQSVEAQVSVRRGQVTVDVPIAVASGPNQTVEATTTLPENASVTVVLDRGGRPFWTTRTVRVGESGHVVATFDLTSRTVGEELDLVVQVGDTADPLVLYYERDAVRVTERGTPTATPAPSPTGTVTSTARPTGATTPTGDSSGSIPGFGAVAALLAMAVGAGLVSLGREQ